jgi:hypothetical protein
MTSTRRALSGALLLSTLISVAIFPWKLTLALSFFSGLIFPPYPLFIGFISEILYYSGTGAPRALVAGASISLVALCVRYLIKTRII